MSTWAQNVARVVDAIGVQYPGVVLGLADVRWESDEQRDEFLALLRGGSPSGSV